MILVILVLAIAIIFGVMGFLIGRAYELNCQAKELMQNERDYTLH